MRVRINVNDAGPIRVVGSMNVSQVSLLEGYNGIGKSSAIRLLLICTGTLPYSEQDRSWNSLRSNLGQVRVQIDELVGTASNIIWEFDTRSWDLLNAPITTEWFSSIRIDGRDASLSDVRQVFRVHRLSGDVGVVDTLVEEIDTNKSWVERLRNRIEAPDFRVLNESVIVLRQLTSVSSEVDTATLAQDQRAVDLAQAAKNRAEQAKRDIDQRYRDIERAMELKADLDQLLSVGPEIDQRLEAVRANLEAAQSEREGVNSELEKLAVAAALGEEQYKELANAEKLLERNRGKLSAALVQLSDAAAALKVDPASDAIHGAIEEAKAALDAVVAEQSEADTIPSLLSLVSSLTGTLAAAEDDELGREQVVADDYAIDPSVSGLKQALAGRQLQLHEVPEKDELEPLRQRANLAARRLSDLQKLPNLLEAVEKFRRLVNTHTQTVTELAKSQNLGAAEQLESLHNRRDELDERVLDLVGERARIVKQRGLLGGGSDAVVLQANLASQLEACGIDDVEGLDSAWDKVRIDSNQVSGRLAESERSLLEATYEHDQHQQALLVARDLIGGSDEFSWVREGLPNIAPTTNDDSETALARLTEVSGRADAAQRRLEDFPNQLLAVERALTSIAEQMRGRNPVSSMYVGELRTWFEAHFRHYFSQEAIRTQLLSAEAEDVEVSILKASVNWKEGGESREKPLDSFSSGQQAFAYARARLAQLDQEDSEVENRLICLDEFGAFMSADRRDELITLLKTRASASPGDRTLLVLPVRTDFSEAAENALGDERKDLLRRAAALESDGLVIEDLL